MSTSDNRDTSERKQDKIVEDSFPASDPPANTGITGAGKTDTPPDELGHEHHDRPSAERGTDARPTGTPTSDRHATETAGQWEDESPA